MSAPLHNSCNLLHCLDTFCHHRDFAADSAQTIGDSSYISVVVAWGVTDPATTTSILTLAVSDSAAVGKSTITVTGTFGTHVHSKTIKLTVTE
ncbi:MAG: hypothetical protein WCB11_09760 [Terriglobales bacterium]